MGTEALENLTEEEQKIITGEASGETSPTPTTPPAQEAKTAEAPTPTPETQKPVPQVPIHALHQARMQEREMKQRLQEQQRVIDELKNQFLQYKNQSNKPVPSFEEDPLTHIKEKLKGLDEIQEQQRQFQALSAKQQEDINRINEISSDVTLMEQDFRKVTPDYDKALSFITEFRKGELADMGITDPRQVNQIIAQNAMSLSMQALQIGKNPAEMVYSIAKRYGYKAEAPTTIVDQAQQQLLNQQKSDLQAIEQGQQNASKTLTGAGKNEQDSNIKALLDAEGTEFDTLWKQIFKNAK